MQERHVVLAHQLTRQFDPQEVDRLRDGCSCKYHTCYDVILVASRERRVVEWTTFLPVDVELAQDPVHRHHVREIFLFDLFIVEVGLLSVVERLNAFVILRK